MKKLIIILMILLSLVDLGWAQTTTIQKSNEYRLWRLTNYTGYVGLRGFYREQYRSLPNFEETSTYPFLYGGIALYTQSYVGHPNLLRLSIGGEYNPGTNNQRYTVSPDRSEVMNLAKLDLQGTLFEGKPMNLSAYLNLGSNIINREYVSSSRTNSQLWGLKYKFINKVLPLTVSYNDREWDQLEVETNRKYYNDQKDFEARVNRSFTKNGDRHEAVFTYNDVYRREASMTENQNSFYSFLLNNRVYFDKHRRYFLRSYLYNLDQEGTTLNQSRFQLQESIDFQLPLRFRLSGTYELFNVTQQTQGYIQHRMNAGLEHQLFESLRTSVFVDNRINDHTAFDEKYYQYGGSVNYTKKIPTGRLTMNYSLRYQGNEVIGDPNKTIQEFDEPHTLTDGQIVLLDRPYVQVESIIVKDASGAIIYQENFDYLVIEQGEFVEIQRLPGGQIANNSAILIDYLAEQIGSFSYLGKYQAFNARLNLINKHLEIYYTIANQDYSNITGSELLSLNYFDRYTYGIRLNVWKAGIGVERDDYQSSIVPVDKMRYYVNISGKFTKKILASLNADITDQVITFDRTPQLYANAFGKVVYMIKPRTKIDFDIGYRKQVGEQIDLDMITARAEFNTVFRNLYMQVGLEVYRRNYIGENLNFRGVYFKVDRRF